MAVGSMRRNTLSGRRCSAQASLHAVTLLVIGFFCPRPAAALVPTGFADEVVFDNLNSPCGIAFLPDGRLLIIEQKTANVKLGVPGDQPDSVLHISDVNAFGGEQGLLGIAVDPDWPARPYVYFYFNQATTQKCCVVMYIASGDLSNPSSTNVTFGNRYDILTDIPDVANAHNAGTLRFGPDGHLYVSIGDDTDDCAAQDSTTLKGKILRLQVSALPGIGSGPPPKSLLTPPDNPFVGANANAGLVWAYGLRNPFRFHIDPATGRLYIADVGAGRYEEVNECLGGENFGWPHYEGPWRTSRVCGPVRAAVLPIAFYDRTSLALASVISAGFYRPNPGGIHNFPADYHGDYFYADFFEGFVRRLKYANGSWGPAPPVPGQPDDSTWASGITMVSDWAVGPDGGLYYVKEFSGAAVRRIIYTGNPGDAGSPPDRVPRLMVWPNPWSPRRGLLHMDWQNGASGPRVTRISIHDVAGRLVGSLKPESLLTWEGREPDGRIVRPGLYWIRLETGRSEAATGRILVVD
jgi:glucose/arabinose dehydrogenase